MSAIEFQEEAFPIYSRFGKDRVLAMARRIPHATLPELLPAHPALGPPHDLRCVSLGGLILREGDFFHADLRGADFRHADAYGADFRYAYLERADFCRANLRSALFIDANAACIDLTEACCASADFQRANLRGVYCARADFRGADFEGSDCRDVTFDEANVRDACFTNANLEGQEAFVGSLSILPAGGIIGWKKCCGNVIVQLFIPARVARTNATGRECRAERALVLEVYGASEGQSFYDPSYIYRPGETVVCHAWEANLWKICAGGIHFYITRAEAEACEEM